MISKTQTWSKGLRKKSFPPLKKDADADVAIIGGGLAGIISAYLISKTGKKVILLEKDIVGSGATSYTTAFLTQSLDTDFSDLIKVFGLRNAKEIIRSHGEAIRLIKKISKECNIDCDFADCSDYIYANKAEDFKNLANEKDAAKKLGLSARMSRDISIFGFTNHGFLEIKRQAKFHPLKFLYGLASKTSKIGAKIYEKTEVKEIESDNKKVLIKTGHGVVTAKKVIVATYEPLNQPWRLYFKKGMYSSYVLDIEVENPNLIEGIYEDTENPYHYMRIDKSGTGKKIKRVIIGGEDHREDIAVSKAKSFNALKSYLDKIFKKSSYVIKAKWTGPVLEPVDGLAMIGTSDKKNIFYVMAFSGNGMSYSGIAAIMARDFVLSKKNPWSNIYSASRIPTLKSLRTKGRDYSMELVQGAIKNTLKENTSPLKARNHKPIPT